MSKTTKPPAVAGTFYPDDAAELRSMAGRFLREAKAEGPAPKALIVPHAGYEYSGPIAASGYARLQAVRSTIERVVLVGPAHRVPFSGLATSGADEFATPLGAVPLDAEAVAAALKLPQVQQLEAAHAYEHSLEVQLPFLQLTLDRFRLVPFAVGDATVDEVSEVLDRLWGGDETLMVISSDLSHFHDYRRAQQLDRETTVCIERLDWESLSGERACGYGGIRGLLKAADARGLHVQTLDLRNSGDTSGMKRQVVGYGAYAVVA